MLRIIIPVLVVALVVVLLVGKRGGLIRGVVDDMLVSPSRPTVAVAPRAGLKLLDARRADLAPTVQGNTLSSTSVQVCYALYQRSMLSKAPSVPDAGDLLIGTAETVTVSAPVQPQRTEKSDDVSEGKLSEARLVALLAVAESPYTWPVQPDTGSQGLEILRTQKKELSNYFGVAETFVLPEAEDPWKAVREEHEETLWSAGSLVRRYTFTLWQRRAKLMIEYREPLPQPGILPLADDIPLLAAFEKRAQQAFSIINGDTSVEKLPRPEHNLPYPPETVNRRKLTTYIGELWDSRN